MSPARNPRFERAKLIELMAYADGELEHDQLAALENELAQNPDGVEVVEAFRGLGDRIRRDLSESPDLSDAIMAAVQTQRGTAAPTASRSAAAAQGAKLLDLAAARARRFKIAAGIASISAVAAAMALWVGRPISEGTLGPEFAASALGVQVQQVDSQENVTVFSIPALHSNASSVVVWLGDDHQDEADDSDLAEPKTSDAAPQPSAPAQPTP